MQIFNKTDKDEAKYLVYKMMRHVLETDHGTHELYTNSPSVAVFDVNSILNFLSGAHVKLPYKYLLLYVGQELFLPENVLLNDC